MKEVWLVEDDKVQVFLLRKYLEKSKLVDNICSFENGKLAYEALEKRSAAGEPFPELIFLDINMPVWDGWDFYRSLQELPGKETVVIFILTSSLSEHDYEQAKRFGLNDNYLRKPLNYQAVETIIKQKGNLQAG
ncbi:MAG: response regulator [Balneolaceae bacterium]|nr:response regulator [Balneolaceae bacterium]